MNVRSKVLEFLREQFREYSALVSNSVWIHSHVIEEKEDISWHIAIVNDNDGVYSGDSNEGIIDALKNLYIKYSRTNPEYYDLIVPRLNSFIRLIEDSTITEVDTTNG